LCNYRRNREFDNIILIEFVFILYCIVLIHVEHVFRLYKSKAKSCYGTSWSDTKTTTTQTRQGSVVNMLPERALVACKSAKQSLQSAFQPVPTVYRINVFTRKLPLVSTLMVMTLTLRTARCLKVEFTTRLSPKLTNRWFFVLFLFDFCSAHLSSPPPPSCVLTSQLLFI